MDERNGKKMQKYLVQPAQRIPASSLSYHGWKPYQIIQQIMGTLDTLKIM